MSSLSLVACGSNAQGQLANGTQDDSLSFAPCLWSDGDTVWQIPPAGMQSVIRVASGANHTLVLLDFEFGHNQLWVCGDNSAGQLNFSASIRDEIRLLTLRYVPTISEVENESHLTIVDIAAAWQTSYLVLRANEACTSDFIISCGSNEFGARGIRSPDSVPSIIQLHHLLDPEETPNHHIEIAQIDCGPRHVIAILHIMAYGRVQRRRLVGWGACRHGQLGDRTEMDSSKNRPITFLSEPTLVDVPGEQEHPIIAVAAGSRHTLVLHSSGRVTLLGSDRFQQLSVVRGWMDIMSIGCTWNGSYAIGLHERRSKLYCVGNNDHGQLGLADTASHIFEHDLGTADDIKISPGSEHVTLLRSFRQSQSQLEGWGWNEHGNLGLGHDTDVMEPTVIMGSLATSLLPLKTWAGCGTTWVLVRGRA